MAGGTWIAQNKLRPGVYINFKARPQPLGSLGDRGIVAYPATLPWGNPSAVIEIEAADYGDKALELLGFRASDPRIRHITSAVAHASKVLLYRMGGTGATKATITQGPLTATAVWGGTRGNALKLVIQANVDDGDARDVITILDDEEIDRQTIAKIADLQSNAFVTWSGTGVPTVTAGVSLTGGTDGASSGADFSAALSAFEAYEFNALGIPLTDSTSKQLAVAYTRRLREDEGKKFVTIISNYPSADYEGVISLINGVITSDGLQVAPEMLVWELAAMESNAAVNQSLTYTAIPNAVDAYPRLTHSETIAALKAGELVISPNGGRAVIEQDVNTLTSFTPDRSRAFSKNRVVRVLDAIANDIKRIFDTYYIGKVDNNSNGRDLLKSEIISYLSSLQGLNAIQNFDSQTDLTVLAGADVDAVVVELSIQPVDSIEKIYMMVEVK